MKNLFWSLCVVAGISFLSWNNPAMAAESAPGNTKQVCLDVKDKAGQPVKNKDGTVKQSCKTVKTHKKHEGTAIEGASKDKK